MSKEGKSPRGIWEAVREQLAQHGIDLDVLCNDDFGMKAICVVPDLGKSVRDMARSARDQVVMVRIDEESSKALDAWVEAGAVKSRSEAAALFIREGLKVHASELDKLEDALKEVEDAKERLRKKVRVVLDADED